MKKEPLFKLSVLLKACQLNPDIPNNFMRTSLPDLISKVESLENSIGHIISPLFVYHKLPQKSVLQQQGKPTTQLWIIEKGCARSYFTISNNQFTTDFHFPGEFIGHFSGYKHNILSEVNVNTITPVTCWSIDCTNIEQLRNNYPAASEIIELLVDLKMDWQYQIAQNQHTFSPSEHYRYLLENYPSYFMDIPLHYIASFLNVSPSSLSRIRARFNNKTE